MMENVNLSMKLCFIFNHYSPGVKINQLKLFAIDKQAVFLKSFIRKIPYSADSRAAIALCLHESLSTFLRKNISFIGDSLPKHLTFFLFHLE